MELIINGRLIITNNPKLISSLVGEGAAKAARVEGRKPGEINLGNRIEKSGYLRELNRKPGPER